MGLRIVIGIMVLGFALQMSRNTYRDIRRTKSENATRYLYGMKVDMWKEPLSKGNRVFFSLVAIPLNLLLYLFAAVVLFNIDLSTLLPFLSRK
ncbi:MAG TPA: hypothetical protein VK452_10080 [Dissulfurispiraceae bacterium]|nr:hypothetical protein [Dissulfurispiraceae bacterium]